MQQTAVHNSSGLLVALPESLSIHHTLKENFREHLREKTSLNCIFIHHFDLITWFIATSSLKMRPHDRVIGNLSIFCSEGQMHNDEWGHF